MTALGVKGSALTWRCCERLLVRGVKQLFVLSLLEQTVVDLLEQDPPLGNGGKNGLLLPLCSAWLRLLCWRLHPVDVSVSAPT